MADFTTCFNWMMDNEDAARAYAMVPDVGGYAISGINSAAWPVQFEKIAALPVAQRAPLVELFYQTEFWNQWYAQLVSNDVAKRVFDTSVNIDEKKAVKLLQNAINGIVGNGSSYTVATDGAWGPQTLTAANGASTSQLVSAFKQLRVAHYQANDANSPYLAQLIARAEK
jgi:lysozyme family protein